MKPLEFPLVSISVESYEEKLLKITGIAMLQKSVYSFQTVKDIDPKI